MYHLRPEEMATLNDIQGVIAKYDMAIGKVIQLVNSGASAQEIDHSVKINDALALGGLKQMSRTIFAVNNHNAATVNNLIDTISGYVNSNAVITLVAVGILFVLSYWTLFLRVIKPIEGINETMQVLAKGAEQTEIPGSTYKDEIEDMATALRIFKDHMIESSRLAQERREAEEQGREILEQSKVERQRAEELTQMKQEASYKLKEQRLHSYKQRLRRDAEKAQHSAELITERERQQAKKLRQSIELSRYKDHPIL
jgi:HAMP domain-containing protein